MRKNLLWISLITMLIISVLSMLSVNTVKVSAAAYPAVYIKPASATVSPSDLYTISVKTNYTGDDINSWQFTLSYNPSVLKMGLDGLNYTDTWTGGGGKKSFETTGKLIVPDSEDVYVGGVPKTKGIDYTIDYQTGMITFMTAPGSGVQVKATYLYCLINGDLINKAKDISATFNPGNYDNVAGKLSLTGAFFFFIYEPAPLTYGPGTLANVTFKAVGGHCSESNITLGPETKLIGYTEGGMGNPYNIVDGSIEPEHLGHGYVHIVVTGGGDVAVIDVAPSYTQAYTKWTIKVNVTVKNEGAIPIDVSVAAYYSESSWHLIGTQTVSLAPGARTSVLLNWNLAGRSYCNHPIKGNASIIGLPDINPANNEDTSSVKIKLAGDVDADGDCDADDVFLYVSPSYGKHEGQPGFIKQTDFDFDGDCDADDVFLYVAPNYGKKIIC